MGGSAFTSAPYLLNTPRMPPHIYHLVRSTCHARLRQLYLCVASPIEGPGKEDHGDVDVLVALERQSCFPLSRADLQPPHPRFGREPLQTVARALGAEHIIFAPDGKAANMAIPWPEEGSSMDSEETGSRTVTTVAGKDLPGRSDAQETDSSGRSSIRHIQVDLRIAATTADLQWALFKHAHGDFWHLVGTTIRPLGLTVDEEGLWIRIPEIEAFDKKRAKIRVSSEPAEILTFLGFSGCPPLTLDEGIMDNDETLADDESGIPGAGGIWERPFGTVEQLFEYVTCCRWFWVTQPLAVGTKLTTPDDAVNTDLSVLPDDSQRDPVAKLSSNDRRRIKGRGVYRAWIEDFIPRLRAEGHFSSSVSHQEMRDRVREEAFARWALASSEYETRLLEWKVQKRRDEIWQDVIKGTIPPPKPDENINIRSVTLSALKKIILLDDQSFDGIVPDTPLRGDDGMYDVDATRAFVEARWEAVRDVAWRIMCEKAAKSMALKESKRKTPG